MFCYISLPDSRVLEVRVDPKAIGQECLEKVCEELGISNESDYFGLKYENSKGEELWLNLRNPIDRQVTHGNNYQRFTLRVKFWVPAHLLLQEGTRRYAFLHAWLDLKEGRLLVSDWDCMARLVALIAQAEKGDYNPQNNHFYLQQVALMATSDPSPRPSDLLHKVITEHKNRKGMKSSTAMYWLLKEVSALDSFGEEMFPMKCPIGMTLGVGPHGISIYEQDHDKHIIPFTAIQSASSHRKTFKLEYLSMDNVEKHLETKLDSSHAASSLYRAITEKHAFYSCETVRSAVTSQFIRDLKGTIVSIFNEDSSLGKKYVFDIRRTCREVYDNARRALYLENQLMGQDIMELHRNSCEGEQCKDSHERLTKLLDAMTCRICMDRQIDTAFLPCAHVVACSTCASKCERCPLCRADISQAKKIYFPGEFEFKLEQQHQQQQPVVI